MGDQRRKMDRLFPGTHACVYARAHTHTHSAQCVVWLQDTNGIIFRALPSVLGVSATHDFAVNSVCVPRTPGEAVGGICRLERSDGHQVTVNVEYNQLDPLLKSSEAFPDGDVADDTGFSPFPGNVCIRFLFVKLAPDGAPDAAAEQLPSS